MLKKQSWQRGSSIETEVLREATHLSTAQIVNNLRMALSAEIEVQRKNVLLHQWCKFSCAGLRLTCPRFTMCDVCIGI